MNTRQKYKLTRQFKPLKGLIGRLDKIIEPYLPKEDEKEDTI